MRGDGLSPCDRPSENRRLSRQNGLLSRTSHFLTKHPKKFTKVKIRGNIEAPCVKTIKKEPRGNNSSGLSLSRFLLDNERFSAGQAHGTKEELFLFVVL